LAEKSQLIFVSHSNLQQEKLHSALRQFLFLMSELLNNTSAT